MTVNSDTSVIKIPNIACTAKAEKKCGDVCTAPNCAPLLAPLKPFLSLAALLV